MDVDQAGKKCCGAEIEDGGSGRNGQMRADSGDLFALNEDDRVADGSVALAVEKQRGAYGNRMRMSSLRILRR